MPFQSEKQRRYLWANEPEIARDWTDTYGSRIKKNDGGITQANAVNYNPSKMVSVPKKFKARENATPTELAYITKDEAGILKALKPDTPHKGPRGIPSYDDYDAKSGTYRSGAAMSAAETGSTSATAKEDMAQAGIGKDEAQDLRASHIAAGGHKTDAEKKDKELKKKIKKAKKVSRTRKSNTRQIEYLQKQKLNSIISQLRRAGYTQFKKGETTFEDINNFINKGQYNDPQDKIDFIEKIREFNPGKYDKYTDAELIDVLGVGKNTLTERWQDLKDKKGNPLYSPETIKKWEKSGYVPRYPGSTGVASLDLLSKFIGTPELTQNQIQDYLNTYTAIGESGDMNWLDRMKKFEPNRYAQHQGDITWNPVSGKFEPKSDGGGPQPLWMQQGYPSHAAWLAAQGGGGGTTEVVEDTPSAFQASLTGTADTPDYYVGSNPLASNIAWGKQAGVDPRTMGIYNQDQFGFPTWAAEGGRIPRAFGGIMDTATGRRAYGFGSIFKKIGRAAKKVFKSPIGKAALIAGAGWFGPMAFSQPAGFSSWGNIIPKKGFMANLLRKKGAGWTAENPVWGGLSPWKLGIMGASALPFFMGGEEEDEGSKFDYEAAKNAYWDELRRIKAGVMAGSLNPNEFSYLPSNYTYTGAEGGRARLSNGGDPLLVEEYKKYVFEMEEMGLEPMSFEQFKAQARAGMYAGGQSTPSDYTMEDALMTTTQDKLGGITDVMKQADLYRQGSVGQFYAADGGRIGYDAGGQTGHPPITMGQVPQLPPQMPAPQVPHSPMPAPQPNRMAIMNRPMMNPMARGMNPMMGGRRMAQEGGLMDLGGMEKDYRNDGGFVPIGGEEKADDVPARLSKNEFVFTADAVRGAGGGDIDKGAEIMENIMKNLEQGGQISDETQGLSGAQEMFGVSERLSEVV